MAAELTVACALIGTKWPDVWVHRLQRMVDKYCSVPYDFKVITDRPEAFPGWGVPFSREIIWTDDHHSRIPNDPRMILNRDKPQGCWAKLDFFKLKGYVIGLDLDVVVTGDISELMREELHMPEDYPGHLNGSIYSFHSDYINPKLDAPAIPYRTYPRGEQEYVAAGGNAHKLPDCYSYKGCVASRRKKDPPPGTKVVFFHGRPTPAADHLQELDWISRTWRGLDRSERI